jgi:hypothetical protein
MALNGGDLLIGAARTRDAGDGTLKRRKVAVSWQGND